MPIKDYLGYENARNKKHAALYELLIKQALGIPDVSVLIGHHLSFEIGGDLNTENEIPAADTLIFDHDIMGKIFGKNAISVMQQLAAVPCSMRDDMLSHLLSLLDRP